ncbi:hypothetical protein GQ44DRAFT_67527 [Phaeosphaeriaceae sp. PMI808]|nr:hypothetical protein GQ44DRAFT_67527 [Phaeosphaeriaceae sp. PMI808]
MLALIFLWSPYRYLWFGNFKCRPRRKSPSLAYLVLDFCKYSIIHLFVAVLIRYTVIGIMIWRLVTTAVPKKKPDLVYDTYLLALQSHLGLWLGILAANLPTLVPLAKRILVTQWNSNFVPEAAIQIVRL